LPHEYTTEDQRADANFLIGAAFGRDQERQRIKAALARGADIAEVLEG
jgi:hypothetical protein